MEHNIFNTLKNGKRYSLRFALLHLVLLAFTINMNAQQTAVTGSVKDSNGLPLPGANILEKGTTNGVTADFDGNFSLDLSNQNSILVVSYIGFATKEVPFDGQSTLSIILEESASGLDEVVVVGYGTAKKREITGAISSIDAEGIAEQTVTGFEQAMAGRLPGVQIVQNSSAPGGSTSVRVRGVGTPGVNEPLYVIDGIPVFPDDGKKVNGGGAGNVLNMINPNDIKSIEVLKDAASAAIYGARAANGVVIITTKKGVAGKPKFSMDYYYGLQSFEKRFDVLGAEDYKEYISQRNVQFTDSPYNTDWLDEVTNIAPIQNFAISVSGGGENSSYYSSISNIEQEGIVKGTDFDRLTGRVNFRSEISEKFTLSSNLTFARSQRNRRSENSIYDSAVGIALYNPPIVPVREPGGEYGDAIEYVNSFFAERPNPVANVETGVNKVTGFKALGNIQAEFEILDGLVYRLNLGLDYEDTSTDIYRPSFILGTDQRETGEPVVSKFNSNEFIWLVENTLTYNFSLNEDVHNFSLLAGATQQASRFETLFASRTGELSKDTNLQSISSSPSTIQNTGGIFSEWSIASFLSRLNYNYKERYLFSATVRLDGSSRFAPDSQWGTFPALSAGWVVSQEPFFKSDFLNDLKLRASWGQLGNQEIEPFQYTGILRNETYVIDNQAISGVVLSGVPNPSITWETSEQTDFGIDAAFLNNQITFSADYFDKNTDGILLENQISAIYGYTVDGGSINPIINAAEVSNKGFEFALGYRTGDNEFKWSADLNLSTLKNEVVSLGGGDPLISRVGGNRFLTITDEGSQVGAFYGKVWEGIDANGNFIFQKDENGEDIQTVIGNPIPNLTYGANFGGAYKNIDFSINWQGVAGNDILAATLNQTGNFTFSSNNIIQKIYDGAGTIAPNVANATGADYEPSSWYVYDGGFLRLRSVQIGYTLPNEYVEKFGISTARLYVTGQNLLTFDNYDVGLNPEVGAFNRNNNAAGVDSGAYPVARIISTGLNIKF